MPLVNKPTSILIAGWLGNVNKPLVMVALYTGTIVGAGVGFLVAGVVVPATSAKSAAKSTAIRNIICT